MKKLLRIEVQKLSPNSVVYVILKLNQTNYKSFAKILCNKDSKLKIRFFTGSIYEFFWSGRSLLLIEPKIDKVSLIDITFYQHNSHRKLSKFQYINKLDFFSATTHNLNDILDRN